jgi:hypothetical protein
MDLQKEVAKIGLLKHHGIPVDGDVANAARAMVVDAGAGEDVVAALDRLLLSERPQDAVRLAGVVLHGLEQSAADDARVRQTRLIVDAAACSESEVVRSFLMAVAERAGGDAGGDAEAGEAREAREGCATRVVGIDGMQGVGTGAGAGTGGGPVDLASLADDLVEAVDDGVDSAVDAAEVRRLVAGLAEACGMGGFQAGEWAERVVQYCNES